MQNVVLIGGGSGFIGKSLCCAVEKLGFTAVSVTRNSQNLRNAISWDDVKRHGLPNKTAAVINVAGELVLNPFKRWNADFESEVWKSRIDTTKLLRDAIIEAEVKPKLWAMTSAIGYYPGHKTKVYDELSTPQTSDYWSKFVSTWEDASTLPQHMRDTRHCIIRTGVILGKNGGVIKNLKPSYWVGFGGPIGDGNQWFPWIHIDDITGIFIHALKKDSVTGVFNGVSPDMKTNREFSKSFASALNRPSFFNLPSFAVTAIFGSVRASMLLDGPHVVPKRVLESGYKFLHPNLTEALNEIVS